MAFTDLELFRFLSLSSLGDQMPSVRIVVSSKTCVGEVMDGRICTPKKQPATSAG